MDMKDVLEDMGALALAASIAKTSLSIAKVEEMIREHKHHNG